MVSLCHLPRSLMMSKSMLPHNIAMAPPARRDRAVISVWCIPVELYLLIAACRNFSVTSVAVTGIDLPWC